MRGHMAGGARQRPPRRVSPDYIIINHRWGAVSQSFLEFVARRALYLLVTFLGRTVGQNVSMKPKISFTIFTMKHPRSF